MLVQGYALSYVSLSIQLFQRVSTYFSYYIPDMDAGVEASLMDYGNCTICTCWICYNGRNHRRRLVEIAC